METETPDKPKKSDGPTRFTKLLAQEVCAWDDPGCSCEAEPRWLLFESLDPTEWEAMERPPNAEL